MRCNGSSQKILVDGILDGADNKYQLCIALSNHSERQGQITQHREFKQTSILTNTTYNNHLAEKATREELKGVPKIVMHSRLGVV